MTCDVCCCCDTMQALTLMTADNLTRSRLNALQHWQAVNCSAPLPQNPPLTCPQGHSCTVFTYTNSNHSCDLGSQAQFAASCVRRLVAGVTGHRCAACDYDVCSSCHAAAVADVLPCQLRLKMSPIFLDFNAHSGSSAPPIMYVRVMASCLVLL